MDHSVMTSLYISCIIFAIFFGCDQVSGKCAGSWNRLSCIQGNGKRDNIPPSQLIDSKSLKDVDPSRIKDLTTGVPVGTNAPSQQDLSKLDMKPKSKDESKQKALRQTLIQLLLIELEEDSS